MTENERVRMIRKDKGLTMEKFGEALGVGKSTISLIESGKNRLTDILFKSICREFNVNENWLRTGEGEMYAALEDEFMKTCLEIGATDLRLQDLIIKFWQLSDESRQMFWDFVDALPRESKSD